MAIRLGRYFWKLFLANATVMALVVAGCVAIIIGQLDRLHEEQLSGYLRSQAAAIKAAVGDRFDLPHAEGLNLLAEEVGSPGLGGVRVTLILADGAVVGDSAAPAASMESHADRPEIRQALAEGVGESARWSHTVARDMKYVAVRVGSAESPRGFVRVALPLRSIAARGEPAQRMVATIAALSLLAAILLASALALLWSRRIQRVTEVARNVSAGDLSARVDVVGRDEVAVLGRSLNAMRENLTKQLDTIDRQRRTLDSILSQLREGVIVAGPDGRIVLINAEAVAMLQSGRRLSAATFVGRTVEQCVPHRGLQDLLTASDAGAGRSGSEPDRASELTVSTTSGDRCLLARAFDVRLPETNGVARRAAGSQVARALVLTDVTELTRVMKVKADFAANASHELRTPISAIRAAVDTLRSIKPRTDESPIAPLVDVIDRHSHRVQAMISDLLTLSRLESGAAAPFPARRLSAAAVVKELRAAYAEPVRAKQLHWRSNVPTEDVRFTASEALLRLVLRNLVDNAIRFTDAGGVVELSAQHDGHAVVFEVADTGCGIAKADQQRVFERFYQVERARSGPDRGTGLGLSIVRHAAATLRATVELQSTLGAGTRVRVSIPDAAGS